MLCTASSYSLLYLLLQQGVYALDLIGQNFCAVVAGTRVLQTPVRHISAAHIVHVRP